MEKQEDAEKAKKEAQAQAKLSEIKSKIKAIRAGSGNIAEKELEIGQLLQEAEAIASGIPGMGVGSIKGMADAAIGALEAVGSRPKSTQVEQVEQKQEEAKQKNNEVPVEVIFDKIDVDRSEEFKKKAIAAADAKELNKKIEDTYYYNVYEAEKEKNDAEKHKRESDKSFDEYIKIRAKDEKKPLDEKTLAALIENRNTIQVERTEREKLNIENHPEDNISGTNMFDESKAVTPPLVGPKEKFSQGSEVKTAGVEKPNPGGAVVGKTEGSKESTILKDPKAVEQPLVGPEEKNTHDGHLSQMGRKTPLPPFSLNLNKELEHSVKDIVAGLESNIRNTRSQSTTITKPDTPTVKLDTDETKTKTGKLVDLPPRPTPKSNN